VFDINDPSSQSIVDDYTVTCYDIFPMTLWRDIGI